MRSKVCCNALCKTYVFSSMLFFIDFVNAALFMGNKHIFCKTNFFLKNIDKCNIELISIVDAFKYVYLRFWGKTIASGWGFKNSFQTKHWFAACDAREYGENCKYNCSGNCLNEKVCDPQNGTCQSCASGFKGEKCDQSTWTLLIKMFYLQFSWSKTSLTL